MDALLSKSGIIETCPVCANPYWINTEWPGLPQWDIPKEKNKISNPFQCPWCNSKIRMACHEKNNISFDIITYGEKINSDIQFKYPLIIDKDTLIRLMENLIKTFTFQKHTGKNKDSISIELNYNNIDLLRKDIFIRIQQILSSHKSIAIPVLDIGQ